MLVIYESAGWTRSTIEGSPDNQQCFARLIAGVQMLTIISNDDMTPQSYIGTLMGLGLANRAPMIKTGHFECSSRWFLADARNFVEEMRQMVGNGVIRFPNLSHLASHLVLLHYMATTGPRPSLVSVEVLAQPDGINTGVALDEEERMILALVDLPVLAKLKVPAYWKSEAVEDACEAKGIDLRWT